VVAGPAAQGLTDVSIPGCVTGSVGQTDSNGDAVPGTDDSGNQILTHDPYGPCPGHSESFAYCNPGDQVLGGGASWQDSHDFDNGLPFSNGLDVEIAQSFPVTNSGQEGWQVSLKSLLGVTHIAITGYAICMSAVPV
jgi:hypothetical protein